MEESFKEKLGRKYDEFRRSGLKSYLKYLKKEQKNAEGKKIKEAYLKYVNKEIKNAEKQIGELNQKLDS